MTSQGGSARVTWPTGKVITTAVNTATSTYNSMITSIFTVASKTLFLLEVFQVI